MIRSMTGYSAVRIDVSGFSASASVKSTNHRYLDLQLRYPAGLEALEPQLRRLVKEHVARGHLEMTISLDRGGAASLEINSALLDAYVAAFRQVREEFGLTSDSGVPALLRGAGMV